MQQRGGSCSAGARAAGLIQVSSVVCSSVVVISSHFVPHPNTNVANSIACSTGQCGNFFVLFCRSDALLIPWWRIRWVDVTNGRRGVLLFFSWGTNKTAASTPYGCWRRNI